LAAGGCVLQSDDAVDDVADRLEAADGVVRNLDIEAVLDLERDIDLVERVDLQFFEGLLPGNSLLRDQFGLRDDGDAALLYQFFVHTLAAFPHLSTSVLSVYEIGG